MQASAGPGALVHNEFAIGSYAFDRAWHGNDVLIDQSDANPIYDRIYVLRRDDTLVVKRLHSRSAPGC